MQNFLPTTNTTPGYLAQDYFTPGPWPGFDEVRNDKEVEFSIQPVLQNIATSSAVAAAAKFTPDYQVGDTFSMAIGNFDQPPTSGTVALQVGATTSGLSAIPYNVSASALQTALNAALTTESKPLCSVLDLGNGSYMIVGATNGAITDGFFAVVSAALLYPISNAFFTKDSNGSGSSPYRYLFTMRQAPMCYAEPTDPLPDADVTVEPTQDQSAGLSVIRTILFTVPQVSAGSFKVNATADSTSETCGTATPTMSAREFGLLLANHSKINFSTAGEDDNISVTVSGQSWIVTAIGDLFDDASFEIVATNNPDDPLIGPMGLSGSINYNTFGLVAYSRTQTGDTFTLTRQIQFTRGGQTRTLFSGPVTIYKELIDASTAVPTPTVNYFTATETLALLADKMDTDAANADAGAIDNLLPSQTGNAGKSLKTDGTNASWQNDAGATIFATVASNEVISNMNSTTYVDSTSGQLSIGVGTWLLESQILVGDSDYASAGSKQRIVFTGTWSLSGDLISIAAGSSPSPFLLSLAVYPNAGATFEFAFTDSNKSTYSGRLAMAVVTVAGTVKIQSAQNNATASDHYVYSGTYLKATRL